MSNKDDKTERINNDKLDLWFGDFGKDLPPDVRMQASCFNFLSLMSELGYGSKADFIKDKMEDCLKNNIISKTASEDSVWTEHQILIEDQNQVTPINPHRRLRYDDPTPQTQYWEFGFKKVKLPEGWRLEKGCGCGRNMDPSNFSIINANNKTVKTLSYFDMSERKDYYGGLMNSMALLDPKDEDNEKVL
ncbi:hypothetical protein Klosneuvirus_2_282 [Klosneuvirus KNV1]|uniref:Uncharacterized protein n=1 Tax=Klosneuvirus KNV1 TaxID=1977640 RepID=A0A1V0SJE2_9VIRU|nr:hypothetical protein Klosneuvirus_2_282 [Klosneuvirus KNV1]